MIKWWRSLFAWRVVRDQGVWLYSENSVTGYREARRIVWDWWSPLNFDWLFAAPGGWFRVVDVTDVQITQWENCA